MAPIVEFVVDGTPISAQASGHSRTRWKAKVAAAAIGALPAGHALVADPVSATVIYFYVDTDLDLDNILKPILDALNGVVFLDDSQVVNIIAAHRDLAGEYLLADASPILVSRVAAGVGGGDFVFVAIELATVNAVL